MSLARFQTCLLRILKHEGGYSDDPRDPGGATNRGVTLATARAYKLDMDGDGDVDKADVRAIGPLIEAAIGAVGLSGLIAARFATLAAANAGSGSLDYAAGSVALIYADPTSANNDLAVKTGASGTGSWTPTTTIHDAISGLAQPFVDLAHAWANGHLPGGAGTKSAKEYADDAAASAGSLGGVAALVWNYAGYLFGVGDGRGFFRLLIDSVGNLWAKQATFDAATITSLTTGAINAPGTQTMAAVDTRGFSALSAEAQGARTPAVLTEAVTIGPAGRVLPDVPPALNHGSEVELVLVGGQSLGAGFANSALLLPTVPNGYMLDIGTRFLGPSGAWPSPSDYSGSSLTTLAETLEYGTGTVVLGQTVMSPALQAIQESIQHLTGVAPASQGKKWIALNVAASGLSIEALTRGYGGASPNCWGQMIAAVTRIKALCDAAGWHVTCRRMFWMQGESNTADSAAAYETKLRSYVADLQTYVKPVLGQTESIQMFSYQTASLYSYGVAPLVALGQAQAAVDDPLIHVVGGMNNAIYHDGVHIKPESTLDMGARLGRASFQVIEQGLSEAPTLRPTSKKFIGKRGIVYFTVPVPPLVIDAAITQAVNAGVSLRSSADTLIPIQNVAVAGNAVTFETVSGSAIPSDATVWIGRDPEQAYNGPLLGPRVALRDSAGNSAPRFNMTGSRTRLHNWALIAQI